MADDIDIEEHDILENPRVKEILPELGSIKTEPLDFDSEDPADVYEDNLYETYEDQDDDQMECDYELSNTMSNQCAMSESSKSNEVYHFSNKIILGSKPCPKPPTPQLQNMVILLEDWGERLNNSPCYCKECKTLFATRNALDAHNMSVHSFLVALDNPVSNPEDTIEKSRMCHHCQTCFEDDNLLIQHLYELLTAKQAKKNEASNPVTKATTSNVRASVSTTTSYTVHVMKCPICACCYKDSGNMDLHLSFNHGIQRTSEIKKVPFDFKCKFCGNGFSSLQAHNKHIMSLHGEFWRKQAENQAKEVPKKKELTVENKEDDVLVETQASGSSITKYKCPKCNKCYPTLMTARRHRSMAHPGENFPIKHIVPKTVVSSKIKKLKSPIINYNYVPKKVLFKCDVCQLHFFNSIIAIAHYGHCISTIVKGKSFKCDECRKLFRQADRKLHELQHKYNGKFKVFSLHNNIYSRVLCRCPKCSVYFEERHFLYHYNSGCVVTSDVRHCSICNLNINRMDAHEVKHTKKKFLKSDFILLDDLVTVPKTASELKIAEKRKLTPADAVPAKKQKIDTPEKEKITLYYCKTCQTFTLSKHCRHLHTSKACKRFKNKKPCIVCGLIFCVGPGLTSHLALHMDQDLELKDFNFASIKTLKPIVPLMPKFPKCTKCGTYYASQLRHYCADPTKNCEICNKKFNELGHELHMLHHKYIKKDDSQITENLETSELIQKYQSYKATWNILYYCETCEVTIDSYDSAVEHSQKHFNNIESYDVNIFSCKVCKLQFEESCFKRHRELHSNRPINRESFKILPYNYSKLMTDDWPKIFASLPKEEARQILSRSIYSIVRTVRLHLFADGPSERTLYKCMTCNKFFDAAAVHNHAKIPDCSLYKRSFKCSKCDICFDTHIMRSKHEKTHSNVNCGYRVVAFNSVHDKTFNSKLDCELQTVKPRVGYNLAKAIPIVEGTVNQSLEKSKVVQIYKCSCGLHFTSKKNIESHFNVCSPNNNISSENCSKCGLLFPTNLLVSHLCNHHSSGDTQVEVSTILTVTLYRCGTCKCLFTHKTNFASHYRQCDGMHRGVECDSCGLLFHKTAIAAHKAKHDKSLDRRPYRIVTMKANTASRDIANPEIYKCKRCNRHYLSLKEGTQHLRMNHMATSKQSRCTDCGLTFNFKALLAHKSEHHVKRQLKLSDFKIIRLDVPKPSDKVPDVTKVPIKKVVEAARPLRENAKPSIRDMTDKEIQDLNKDHQTLFKCERCDLHYFNFKSIQYHFEVNHKMSRSCCTCNKCGLKFSRMSYLKHKLHHSKKLFNINNLRTIPVVHEDFISKSLESIEGDSADMTDQAEDDIEKVDGKKTQIMYKCGICGVNYAKKCSLFEHFSNGKHDLKSVSKCTLCGLLFPSKGVSYHKLYYHEQSNYLKMKVFEYDSSGALEAENVKKVSEVSKTVGKLSSIPSTEQEEVTSSEIFKCEKCSLYFVTKGGLMRHIALNHKTHGFKVCDVCGLNFAIMALHRHKSLHHEKMKYTLKDFRVFKIDKRGRMTLIVDDIKKKLADSNQVLTPDTFNDRKLYRCSVCSLHFLNLAFLKSHTLLNDHKDVRETCVKCGIDFTVSALKTHNKLHHGTLQLSFKDFEIIENANESKIGSNDDSLTPNHKIDKKEQITDEGKKNDDLKDAMVFKCTSCDICFMHSRSIQRHFDIKHAMQRAILECPHCDLRFSQISLPKHTLLHHEIRKYTRDDLIVQEYNEKSFKLNKTIDELSDYSVLSDRTSQNDASRFADDSTSNVTSLEDGRYSTINENAKIILYKCTVCEAHFLKLGSLQKHIYLDAHFRGFPCSDCGFKFSKISLRQHLDTHHGQMKLTAKDFQIYTLKGTKQLVPLDNTSKLDDSLDLSNASDKDSTSNDMTMNKSLDDAINENTPTKTKAKHKVYRCKYCNVYFLRKNTLQRHIYRKVPIKGTACSKCGLNFSKRSMKLHKILHHKKYNLTAKDFHVIELSFLENEYKHVPINNTGYSYDDSDPSDNDDDSDDITSDEEEEEDAEATSSSNVLYKCIICETHFFRYKSAKNHMYQNKHFDSIPCADCGLTFTKKSVVKHHTLHHEHINLTANDFRVITVKDAKGKGAKLKVDDESEAIEESALPRIFDDTPDEVTLTDTDKESGDEQTLYKCSKCPMHFIKRKTLRNHIEDDSHKETLTMKCAKCGYLFTKKSLRLHLRAHHEGRNARAKDFRVVVMQSRRSLNNSADNVDTAEKEKSPEPEPSSSSDIWNLDSSPTKNNVRACYSNTRKLNTKLKEQTSEIDVDKVQSGLVSTTTEEDLSSNKTHSPNIIEACDNDNTKLDGNSKVDASETTEQLKDSTLGCTNPNKETDVLVEKHNNISTVSNETVKSDIEIKEEVIEIEDDVVVHACSFCSEVFKSKRAKDFHESLDHLDAVKECPICKKNLNMSILNELHLKISGGTFVCCVCYETVDYSLINQHSDGHKT